MSLPTLYFRHTFSNGIVVNLAMHRDGGLPAMIPDRRDFHDGVEGEYREWVQHVAERAFPMLTDDEKVALAKKAVQLLKA
jgi:hypothetical protein